MATRSVSLHDEHAAATRTRIVEAVVNLIVEEHPATLSVPAVAARAGVSLRTVYRYFPNKEALLDAVTDFGDQPTVQRFPEGASLENLREYMVDLWGELQHTKPLVRAQQLTPLGQEMSRTRATRRMATVQHAVADAGIEVSADDERRLVALISLLLSRTTLFELTDVYGLSVEEAARLAAWAVRATADTAQHTKEVGR